MRVRPGQADDLLSGDPGAPRRVLLVLPHPMSARIALDTDVLPLLAADPELAVTVVSRDRGDAAAAEAAGGGLEWVELPRPRGQGLGRRVRLRLLLSHLVHLQSVYRFNHRHGFVGFRNRLAMSRRRRWVSVREAHPASRLFGLPLPGSGRLLAWTTALHHESRLSDLATADTLVARVRPDLVVAVHVQTPLLTPLLRAARRRQVPALGMIGSWDQPTTKGPVAPHLDHLVAQSRYVRDELVRLHAVDPDRVTVVGWPQLDAFVAAPGPTALPDVLAQLGIGPERRVVLFGAYAARLGAHERAVLDELSAHVRSGRLGEDVTLVVRAHPLDDAWEQRFQGLHVPPHVVVQPPSRGRLPELAALLRHASVVVSSAGTICLDAAAVDTPAVGLAFSATPVGDGDHPLRLFESEHYASAVATGGIRLVHGTDELVQVLAERVQDRTVDADGRARLRALHLEPLDGRASWRLWQAVRQAAGLVPA